MRQYTRRRQVCPCSGGRGRHGRLQPGLGIGRTTCPPKPRSTTPSSGSNGWDSEPDARSQHDLAHPASRNAASPDPTQRRRRRPGRLAPVVGKARENAAGRPGRGRLPGADAGRLQRRAGLPGARRRRRPTSPAAATWTATRCPWAPWWSTTSCSPAPPPSRPPRRGRSRDLGLSPVEVRPVDVASTGIGPEAAARDARHAALETPRPESRAPA